MKKLLLALLIPFAVFAQEPSRPQTFHHRITVDFDSTETKTIFFTLEAGNKWQADTTAINPNNWVQSTGDLEVNFRLDSMAVSTEFDSLTGYFLELNHEGYPKGDTLWIDWENFTVNSDSTIEYISWVPWNRSGTTLGVTKPFSVNLTNKFAPCYGLKAVFTQVSNDSGPASTTEVDMHARMTFDINPVR